ncbi:acyl-ACP--UDP-N-acetylglucosamine O-acyltransferase [Parasynechococcus sp.]|uniref:acyl-ACP--UDP-N-acetylglucosamine O-acyltransferase n=1 Tax=Parasynechococcus sp. TaxID=3101203 RepID=UPI003703F743
MTEGQTVDKPIEIHPSAVVDPKAELASGVVIGPGAVIGPDVVIGANSWIGPHAVLDGRLTLGRDNKVFPGACLGLEPQDLKYRGADTEVVIGDGNTFRECVTINRATEDGERTVVGHHNLLMAYCHLGHNCELGDNIVMSNGIQVAGHVVIEDRAVVGGCLGIHQFVHIGGMAMVGGMTRVDRDVPPYCLVEGHPGRVRGLNKVGLRRSGLAARHDGAEFKQLQEIWTLLYRSDLVIAEGLKLARQQTLLPAAEHLCGFLEASIGPKRRGPLPAQGGR